MMYDTSNVNEDLVRQLPNPQSKIRDPQSFYFVTIGEFSGFKIYSLSLARWPI